MEPARGREVIRIDVRLCSLCGAPNDCALARGDAEEAAPCWCVERRFPEPLLERARARDGAQACVCRGCLEAALASEDRG